MLSENRKNEVVSLCQTLIREKSLSGEESGVAGRLKDYFISRGFDSIQTDEYGNVIGCIKGLRPGKKLLFDGHMDVVPVPDPSAWKHPPFGAEISGERIYGRGASDMKGALAACACAAAAFAEDRKKDFAGEIYVVGSVHEECFEGVASRLVSGAVKPDYVIIGESSRLNLKIGQRGRAEIVVETFGKPAHSSNPREGINAVYGMTEIIAAIRNLEPGVHPRLGEGILELTDVVSSPYPGASVVPEYCRATYDRRLLIGETRESVLAPIQALLDELMAHNPLLKASVSFARGRERCYTGAAIEDERFFPAWLFDENEDFVQSAYKALRAIGQTPEISHYAFCTNGSHYAGEKGIKTLGLGPSLENIAHTIDEYIELSQLAAAVEAYIAVAGALLI
ncbi:MAG: YgeY family selenium metabolism-linked hydrolase [Spirochaetales bacterium]|jgi:putative selenium metabolism hydrolase|nr:YgeY family selenium metabolism-linked hydrolase [Spirochaetales bacterium]